jgi:hypothetical protein
LVLGDLIPKHGTTGHVRSLDGKEWEYLITEFIENSMTMQAVWEKIELDNKEKLIQQILQAVISLRSILRDDERVKTILFDKTTNKIGGGTSYGRYFFPDVAPLLCGILAAEFPKIQPKQVSIVTEQGSGDVIVRAENVSEPAVRLSIQDLSSSLDHHVH